MKNLVQRPSPSTVCADVKLEDPRLTLRDLLVSVVDLDRTKKGMMTEANRRLCGLSSGRTVEGGRKAEGSIRAWGFGVSPHGARHSQDEGSPRGNELIRFQSAFTSLNGLHAVLHARRS